MIRIMDTSGIQISSIVRTTASGFRMLPVFGCLVSDHQCTMIPSNFSKRQLKIYDTRPSMCNTSMYNKSHLKCFLVGPSGLYIHVVHRGLGLHSTLAVQSFFKSQKILLLCFTTRAKKHSFQFFHTYNFNISTHNLVVFCTSKHRYPFISL